jgi:hypothetical protein
MEVQIIHFYGRTAELLLLWHDNATITAGRPSSDRSHSFASKYFRKHRQCLVLSLPLPAAAVSLEVPNGTSYQQVVHVRKGHKLYFILQPSAHEIQSCLFDLFKFIVNILKRIDLPFLSADIALSSKTKLQKKTLSIMLLRY